VKFQQFARRWWPVGLGALIGLVIGVALVIATPKTYTATSTLFLGAPDSTDSTGAYSGDLFSQQRATTYSQLAKSRDLAVKVIDDLALNMTPDELSAKISADQIPKTVLVRLTVKDSSPQRAADIANALATDFTQYIARLETPVASNQPISDVTIIQTATVPSSPSSLNAVYFLLAGLLGGTAVGLFGKWLMSFLDRTVRTAKQVSEFAGAPVLGVLPRDAGRRSRMLDLTTDTTSSYVEAVRKLRTNLLYADVDSPPKTIAFISPDSGVSTTATATNLAVILDGIGRHVALIDGDMRESRVSRYIGVEADRGLTSVITGDIDLDGVIVKLRGTGVDVLLAGPQSKTASEVLASDSLPKLLTELQNGHDFVFCDTPGLLKAADAAVIGLACDGVVLVATQGKTRTEGLMETAEILRNLGAKIIGAVLTEAR
jgi:succinoglycan biosynthesis transport protein ExoP